MNLLLSEEQSCRSADGLARRELSLAAFEASLNKRKPNVEHSVLNRINCHIEKFGQLFKSVDIAFNDKNRYKDMLPFRFNRVVLNKEIRPFESLKPIFGSFLSTDVQLTSKTADE